MALVLADRVRDTTTITGTGTITLSGTAPTGYQNFSVVGNGNTTYYTINADSQWEVGIGTYSSTGPTLSRGTVLASSNGGALVDFAAGIKDVFITYPAEKAVTDAYGTALAATTATNIAGGAAGSIPYQTAANTTSLLAAGTGVLVGGSTPSYTMSPSLTQVTVAADPTAALQVATKQYVDTIAASGVTYHTPVKYEVPSPLTATYNNGSSGVGATLTNAGTLAAFAPDGPVASVGDRILVYTQTNAAQNGVYTVTTVGSGSVAWVLTRATDADTYALKSPNGLGEGDAFFVMSGNTGAGETYVMNTVGTITFGTTAINFVQVSDAAVYSAGTGLTLTGTVFSLTSPVATTLGGTGLTSFTSGGAVYATSSSALTTGTLPATAGGTGQSSYTTGDLIYATSGTTLGALADVATGNALLSGGVGTAPAWGKVGLTTHVTGTLPVANGGTGATSLTGYLKGNGTSAFTTTATIPTSDLSGTISLTTQISGTLGAGNGGTGISSYTVGDILYASATTTLSTLSDVATGNALISGGVSNPPSWGKIGLTTHVSGTLPVSNGGSGATTLTGYLKGNGTSAFTASATIPAGDITGAALTKADDTNVTLTLGGSPSTALLAATSITAGWTGQLAVSRGGTGNSTLASGYLLKGNGVSPVAASIVYDNGTNVGIGTTSSTARLASQINSGNYLLDLINGSETGFALRTYNHGSASAPGLVFTQGIYYGTTENAAIKFYRGGGATGGYLGFTVSDGTERLSINSSGNVAANVDMRAPIFYDSGNTAYFGNFDGTSRFSSFLLGGNETFVYESATNALSIRTGASGAYRYFTFDASGNFYALNGSVYGDTFYDQANTAYYANPAGTSNLYTVVTNAQTPAIAFKGDIDGAKWMQKLGGYNLSFMNDGGTGFDSVSFDGRTYYNKFYLDNAGNAYAYSSFRAPIFYDSNNTGYYVDPAGTSNINSVTIAGTISIAGTYGRSVAGSGYLNGNYNSVETNSTTGPIYCISTSYAPTGTSLSNMYGIGYTDGATAGVYSGAGWGLYVAAAGVARVFLDGNSGITFSNGSVRSPVFYDLNDTGYYVDPASTSNALITAGNGTFGSTSPLARITARNVTSGVTPADSASIVLSNRSTAINGTLAGGIFMDTYRDVRDPHYSGGIWFTRNQEVSNLSSSSDIVFGAMISWDSGLPTERMRVYGSGGYVGATNSFRAPIFYDSNDTGYFVDPNSTSVLSTVRASYVQFSSGNEAITLNNGSYQILRDPAARPGIYIGGADPANYYDNTTHYFRDRPGNIWFTVNSSYGQHGSSLRAPIFYDSDNTGYYVNPAGTSYVLGEFQVQQSGISGLRIISGTGTQSLWVRAGYDTDGSSTPASSPYNIEFQSSGSSGGSFTFVSGNTKALTITSDYAQGAGSLRAPIFYDSNDTGYYLDPNGTSNLNRANFTAQSSDALSSIYIGGQNVSTSGSLWINFHSDGDGAYRIGKPAGAWTQPLEVRFYTGQRFRASASYGGFQFIDYNTNGVVFDMANGGSFTRSNVDFYAPIMYDNNNTAYYVDPTGTSNFAGLTVANRITGSIYGCTFTQDSQDKDDITTRTTTGFYQSSTGTTAEGWPLNDGGWQHMLSCTHTNTGNYFAMQLGAGFFSQGLFYRSVNNNGSQAWSRLAMYGNNYSSSLYANIYYDSNNTGYYVDADSESVLNTLTLFGELNLSASGINYIDHTGTIYFRNQSGYATSATLTTGGNFTATGNVTAYSDARLKEDVETIEGALDLVAKMRGVTYTRKDTGSKGVGVIAQEMQEVIPQVVEESAEGTLSVAYGNLVGVLIEAVKELTARVAELEGK